MAHFVLLDSGPLGQLCGDPARPISLDALMRVDRMQDAGTIVVIPEIADYEVRRELHLRDLRKSLTRLITLRRVLVYNPITTAIMERAAEFWAISRQQGKPTSHPHALDGDVILAAQAHHLVRPGDTVTVATTNVGHLNRFVDARDWATMA